MNRRLTAAALGLAVFASLARAEDPPAGNVPQPQLTPQAQLQQKVLQMFDANKDGKLTGQELLAASEYLRRLGVVGGIEPGGFPGAEQFNKQFDANGDGKLDAQEKLRAQAAYQRLRSKRSGPAAGIGFGGQAGVGGLVPMPVPNEAAGGAGGDEAKPKRVSPLVKRFDKDGDGKLNDEEKAAAQAELKKKKDGKSKDEKDKP